MTTARAVALEALGRIREGAYANLVVPALLRRTELADRDRQLVTALVYGTVRRQRACDHLVDRFTKGELDGHVRDLLRLGAFQLAYLGTPAHAAVGETVQLAPRRVKGLVNAVLRKVAGAPAPTWPSLAVELSYPDWIVDRLTSDLGADDAIAALRQMNDPASATHRADGYVQDRGSQWVVEAMGLTGGEIVLDLCAAPGGKSTAMAGSSARVVAADVRESRAGLVASNADRLGHEVATVVADGRAAPFVPGSFDHVLVDAPCSGLGVLHRRPDARWRIEATSVDDLSRLQVQLLGHAFTLARPGAVVTYSVCTMTDAETRTIDEAFADRDALPAPGPPWRPWGRGALLLPQTEGTDGMYLLRLAT
jgi:16S rRNA (cytosine967-C5)-methyltransferase